MGGRFQNAARDRGIEAAYRGGRNIRQIAADPAVSQGLCFQRIQQVLAERGVPMRARGGGNRWKGRHHG